MLAASFQTAGLPARPAATSLPPRPRGRRSADLEVVE